MIWVTDNEIKEVMQEVVDKFLLPRFHSVGYQGSSMRATGEWERSLEVSSENNVGKIRGRDYSESLAKGAKPHMPPVADLVKWAKAKFGYDEVRATRMAWGVAKKIQREGTEYYKEGGTTLMEVLEEKQTTDYILDRLGGIIRVRLSEQLIRNAQ